MASRHSQSAIPHSMIILFKVIMMVSILSCSQQLVRSFSFPARALPYRIFLGYGRSNDHSHGTNSKMKGSIMDYTDADAPHRDTIELRSQARYIILWRGEREKGYSSQFRQSEFLNALSAVSSQPSSSTYTRVTHPVTFSDATPAEVESDDIHGVMQYLCTESETTTESNIRNAAERCSLVRDLYEIIAEGETYEELASLTIEKGALCDLIGDNAPSWCVRLRQYGPKAKLHGGKRFGRKVRSSISLERKALASMAHLLEKFDGPVDLKQPNTLLYLFEGLQAYSSSSDEKILLARRITTGPKTSTIAPKTRICLTRTPLNPIAAYLLVNSALLTPQSTVLDPYAGSCTTLLAASLVAPGCRTVGIEISDERHVNRTDVVRDFVERKLTLPVGLLKGDCTAAAVREEARGLIGGAFDAVVADPPYGIREKKAGGGILSESDESRQLPPLVQLIECIADDRRKGTPTLKRGGRLVAFVPTAKGEDVWSGLPGKEILMDAGLKLVEMREQLLSDVLSRWLVVFDSV